MSDHVMIAFSSPVDGQENEYLAWYKDQHMPDILAVDGIDAGTLYEIDATLPNRPAQFVSVYHLSQLPEAVLADMTRRSGAGQMRQTDALDMASASLMFCRALLSGGKPVTG